MSASIPKLEAQDVRLEYFQPRTNARLAFGQVARAMPDGQTLGWISTGFPVMAATLSNLTFKPESDFVHVCNVSENPFVLVVENPPPG